MPLGRRGTWRRQRGASRRFALGILVEQTELPLACDETARVASLDCVHDHKYAAEVSRGGGKSVKVAVHDADEAFAEGFGNGQTGDFEVCQDLMELSSLTRFS